MGFAFVAVQRFQVEVQLAEVFGLKAADLELNGNEAVEASMEKQQIQSKVLAADLQRVLGADKTEIAA